MEWTDQSKSAFITITIIIFFSFGLMILSGVAYLIPEWRVMQLVLLSPMVLLVAFLYWSATPSRQNPPTSISGTMMPEPAGLKCFQPGGSTGTSPSRPAGS